MGIISVGLNCIKTIVVFEWNFHYLDVHFKRVISENSVRVSYDKEEIERPAFFV